MVNWDIGVGITYWFAPHFGLGVRALADVGVVASGSTHAYSRAEQDRAGAVVGGYTASLGLAF